MHAGKKADVLVDYAWSFIAKASVLPERPRSGPTSEDHVQQYGSPGKIAANLKERGKFVPGERFMELRSKLIKFMEDHIYPMENEFYKLPQSPSHCTVHPAEETLKELAKREGLWNLFMPLDSAARARGLLFDGKSDNHFGSGRGQLLTAGLSNLEYGHLCEIMGRSVWAPQILNCGYPILAIWRFYYGMEIRINFKSVLFPCLKAEYVLDLR